MPDLTPFERRLSDRLAMELAGAVRPFDPRDVANRAKGAQRAMEPRSRPFLLVAAAMLLVGGLVAVGSGLIRWPSFLQPPLPWPLQGVLEPTGSLAGGAQDPVSVLLADGSVLVITSTAAEGVFGGELWDPATGRFRVLPPMARSREHPLAVVLADGRVLLSGGDTARTDEEPTAEVFDPATGSFSLLASRPATIDGSAVRLTDGRVLFTGGATTLDQDEMGLREIAATAEIFDPASGAFHKIGPMRFTRIGHELELLPDGRVLVLGGEVTYAQQVDQPLAEIFDPQTGRFDLAERPALSTKTHDYSVKLPDGRLAILRQPGWAQYPDRSLPMTVTFYDLESGVQTDGPTIPSSAPVYDVRTLIPLSDSRLLLVGFDKASFQIDDLGHHAKGWLGVLDLDTGELAAIAVRDASWGTAVPLPDRRVLLIGGAGVSECPTPGGGTAPCFGPATGVDVLR